MSDLYCIRVVSAACRLKGKFAGTLFLFFVALLGSALYCQDAANLSGTVKDPAGANVPDAAVSVTSSGTRVTRTTHSNGTGFYALPQLPPGLYSLRVERQGFQTIERTDLNLTTGQQATLDFNFKVTTASQSVDVSSVADMIDTSGSSLSTVVQGRQVEQMPLNGRNVLNLVTLVPGVVPQGSSQGNPLGNQNNGAFTQPGGFGNYQIGGGFAGQSVIYIDGAPDNLLLQNNYVSIDPTQDAIQEFAVETNNVSARFGGFNGGVINMTTKSGANAFHGTAYEYIRNRVLNANTFFNKRAGLGRPLFTQNQFGATLSGPIKRDKTFFFFSWEDFRLSQGTPLTLTVPTARMRTGDFGEICTINPATNLCTTNASGEAVGQIYDPCGGTVTVAGAGCPSYSGPRTALAGNVIPDSRIDPTARVMLNFFPLPNLPGYTNNFAVNAKTGGTTHEYNARIDHQLTANQRLFGRYTQWKVANPALDPYRNGTGDPRQDNNSVQAVGGYTWAIRPTTVLDVRGSWLYLHYFLIDDDNIDLSQFGPNYAALSPQIEFHILPVPSSISGGYTNGYVLGARQFQQSNFEDATAFVSLVHVIGKHSVEVGGQYSKGKRFPGFNVGNGAGAFSFNNGFTSRTLSTQGSNGYGLASFELGYSAGGSISIVQPVTQLLAAQGYYATDTWQASPRLTLNMGVRWDSPGAIYEKNDLDTVFLPNAVDPLGPIVNPISNQSRQLVGQLTLVNTSAYSSRYERKQDHGLFSPRFGFAERVTDTDVLRGGFGISFTHTIGTDVGPRQSPINSATTAMVNSINGGVSPNATLSNPFPNTTLLRPSGRNQTALFNLTEGQSIIGMVPTQPWSYAEQWNLSLEHQFTSNITSQLAYAGANGIHLSRNGGNNLNQLPDQYDYLGTQLTTSTPNPLAGRLAQGSGINGSTVPLGQLLRPYPQYQTVSAAQTFGGQSNYHSLQAELTERFHRGGTILASYTWSKLIDNVDSLSSGFLDPVIGVSQDYTRLDLDRSESSFSARHRAVISYVVDLPFGRNGVFLRSLGTVEDRLVSGWSVNGITSFQSGYPLPIIAQPGILQSFGAGSERPNVATGCVSRTTSGSAQSRLSQWFNRSCFVQPAANQFGNERRVDDQIRLSGIANWDTALMKTTRINERVNFQFTTEVFNLFNRVQFGIPGNQLGTGNFGVIASQLNQPRLIQFSGRITF